MTAVELPSPSLVLTRIVVVEAVAGTQGPLVVEDMPAAELGPPVPSCLHSSLSRSMASSSAPRLGNGLSVGGMVARETSVERCRESAGGLGHHARGFHNNVYGTS